MAITATAAAVAAVGGVTAAVTAGIATRRSSDDDNEATDKSKEKKRRMIARLTLARHAHSYVGIAFVKPSISWRFRDVGDEEDDSNKEGRGWFQSTHEIRFTRGSGTSTSKRTTTDGSAMGTENNGSSKKVGDDASLVDNDDGKQQQQRPRTTTLTKTTTTSYVVDSSENVHVPWPAEEPGLGPRERLRIGVRVKGGPSERSSLDHGQQQEGADARAGDDGEGHADSTAAKTKPDGDDGAWSEWFEETFEAALTLRDAVNGDDDADVQPERGDSGWHGARFISTESKPPKDALIRPFYARTTFELSQDELDELRRRDEAEMGSAGIRCYATALGCYTLQINGQRITTDTSETPRLDVLAPGWQAYQHRLHYQTYVVPASYLCVGRNTLLACVGEGWYAGRLLFNGGKSRLYGEEIGVRVALFVSDRVVVTDEQWETAAEGPLISSEIYDGEVYDARVANDPSTWTWSAARELPDLPSAVALIAPESPPIREMEEINVKEVLQSPSGKTILDFGQNLVGYLRLTIPSDFKGGRRLVIRHAEVLEKTGELGVRPLRAAKATDTIILGGGAATRWTPTFTFHGFRYAELELLDDDDKAIELDLAALDVRAIVIHSDMERLGDFTSSHDMVNQLHRNVVWGLRGNFVGIPSDCPQRDER